MMEIYSIKDVKIGFMNPFYQNSTDVAKRSFKNAVADKRGNLWTIKDDLELWKLGSFDENTGALTPETPEYIMGGKDVSLEQTT